jgi:hypothetical protein
MTVSGMFRVMGVLAVALAASGGQATTCYAVYSPDNRLIWRSDVSPVDLARPLSDTVRKVFPAGSALTFADADASCTPMGELRNGVFVAPLPSGHSARNLAAEADWKAQSSGVPTAQELAAAEAREREAIVAHVRDANAARAAHDRRMALAAAQDARLKAAAGSSRTTTADASAAVPTDAPVRVATTSSSSRSSFSVSRRGRRR